MPNKPPDKNTHHSFGNLEVFNTCGVFSEHQLREALRITKAGWPKFKRLHGLKRPKLNDISYYTKEEIHEFIAEFNRGTSHEDPHQE